LVNRVDPVLFGRCFEGWIKALWPGRHDLIAIDGKTPRRTHDKRKGLKALHTPTDAHSTRGFTSLPRRSTSNGSLTACVATGASRACIG
jgi:hypothetical protein